MHDTQQHPDITLLEAWRTGTAAAGNELCRRFQGKLERFFGSKVPPQDVDEMVQQTWLTLTQVSRRGADEAASASALPIHTSFRGYLFGIARHIVLRYHRTHCRDRTFDPDIDSVETLMPSLSRQLSVQRRVKRLELVLQSLPLELQLLVEARYIEELSGPELAAVFEIPEGTVRSRLSRARRLIDDALERAEKPASGELA